MNCGDTAKKSCLVTPTNLRTVVMAFLYSCVVWLDLPTEEEVYVDLSVVTVVLIFCATEVTVPCCSELYSSCVMLISPEYSVRVVLILVMSLKSELNRALTSMVALRMLSNF